MTKGPKASVAAAKTRKSELARLTKPATSAIRQALDISGASGADTSGRKSSGGSALALAVSPLALLIPTPPSINEAFGNKAGAARGRGRYPKPAYKAWAIAAGWRINQQRPKRFVGPVVVMAAVGRKSSRADIDNRTKLILDILKTTGIYKDDSQVTAIAFVWTASRDVIADTRLLILSAKSRFGISFIPQGDASVGGFFLSEKEDE